MPWELDCALGARMYTENEDNALSLQCRNAGREQRIILQYYIENVITDQLFIMDWNDLTFAKSEAFGLNNMIPMFAALPASG
jgi:hypothetical protein